VILLDTDTCIAVLRGNEAVRARKARLGKAAIISAVTAAELFFGAEKSGRFEKNRQLVEDFLLTVSVIEINLPIARKFGTLKAALVKDGRPLPDADIFVAATALVCGTCLVTGNTRHFSRFHDLAIENWLE